MFRLDIKSYTWKKGKLINPTRTARNSNDTNFMIPPNSVLIFDLTYPEDINLWTRKE
jgi:hypothetical protein